MAAAGRPGRGPSAARDRPRTRPAPGQPGTHRSVPQGPARTERNPMFIGIGTIVLIVIIVLVVLMLRRR